MASAAKNREACRDFLATLLESTLVTALEEVQAVYNYQKGRLIQSPVVMVVSAGSEREPGGLGSEQYRNEFFFLVKVCLADADAAAGWTEQEVEDALDNLERRVCDVVMDNRSTAQNGSVPWEYLRVDGRTQVVYAPDLAGNPYVIEAIPVTVTVFD